MDSLTQIAVGIATVEGLAGKELKNKSFLWGAILGTLPDLDVWMGKLFPYELELAFHRGFSHSILGILILSPLIAWMLSKWVTVLSWRKWTILIASVLATHILIDLFTSWGVQLFYPFTHRYSFKTIFVVDIFYTLSWCIALFMVFKTKVLTKRKRYLHRGFLWSSAYLMLTVLVKLFVVQKVEGNLGNQGQVYSEIIVKPTFSNCLLWNINVKKDSSFLVGDYSLFDKSPIQYIDFPRDLALESRLDSIEEVKTLIQVSEDWFTIDSINVDQYLFNDLRFGWLDMPQGKKQFVFSYALSESIDGMNVSPSEKSAKDGAAAFRKIGYRIFRDL